MCVSLRSLLTLMLAIPALLAAGCSSGDEHTVPVAFIGDTDSPFETGGRLSPPARAVRAATAEGLVGFDEEGRVVPALADRWIITDDGLGYVFRLRDATWLDGAPLTAVSVRTALRQAQAELKDTSLGDDLSVISEIRAMAGRVIELRLAYRHPDLLQLLAQAEMGLVRQGEGAGPMSLMREGDVAVLTPVAPGKRGLPNEPGWNARARTLRLTSVPADRAVKAFLGGTASLMLGGRAADWPLSSEIGIARGVVHVETVPGLFGLSVVHSGGFLADSANREAIAMAIDRDALAKALDIRGWTPSTRLVSPGMEGDIGTLGERWAQLGLGERRATTLARVIRWQNGGNPAPVLRVALPLGPGMDKLFVRLRDDLAAVGMQVRRVTESADAELRLVDAAARYPRASWFLGQFACSLGRGMCSTDADRLSAEARRAPDGATRSALLAEAEAELTTANVYIPLGSPVRWSAVRRDVTGFTANRWAIHPLMPLAMLPK